ncbi:MAG: hypothetical protein K8I30_19015, partial [Anaerolineae bacterium]|nr:hypothetical protein [Anaerolineae bacterium]
MKRSFIVPLILALFALVPGLAAQRDQVVIRHLTDDVWVVENDLPATIDLNLLRDLYQFLDKTVIPVETSPFLDNLGELPIILRFVPPDTRQPFPNGAEGFAGLCDCVRLVCQPEEVEHGLKTRVCDVVRDDSAPADSALFAVVETTDDPNLMTAAASHEIAHMLGAVDAPLNITFIDHPASLPLVPDQGNTYWYSGVEGIFELQPTGIVWEALNGTCDQSG